ncbi:hypothetical protein [Streptomyces bohaiensis]|uniref:hypothetical protein n=1 Tax=Streptomyces bohaiensis TaxID=1431344 RepID=UPI003B79F5F5
MSSTAKHYGVGQTWKSGPGGSISISSNKSGSYSTTFTGGGGMTVGILVAEVKADVSAGATRTSSWSTGYTFNRNIPAGKYGNVRYGTWGHEVRWERYYEQPNCNKTQRTTGTGKVANTAHGFRYWSTNS